MNENQQHLAHIDWHLIRKYISNIATSELGKGNLEQLQPHTTQFQLEEFRKKTKECITLNLLPESLDFSPLDQTQEWLPLLKKNQNISKLQFKSISLFFQSIYNIETEFEKLSQDEDQEQKDSKYLFLTSPSQLDLRATEALSAIYQIFTEEGDIRSDASQELYQLFTEKNNLQKNIQQTLDKLVRDRQLESILQDRYVTNREGRWVLPVITGMQHRFQGIIHDSSNSKQTVFMEPQSVIPLNNRLKEVELQINQEVERLLQQLSQYFQNSIKDIESLIKWSIEADLHFSVAAYTKRTHSQWASFSKQINLKKLTHPLLHIENHDEQNHKPPVPVSNDLFFDNSERILILTGPNAGGKTVLLKALGLAAYMHSCGLPICASQESSLPLFKNILIGVGDPQNVESHLSTFAGHLKILEKALDLNGPENLILIDEICGSTDPQEGGAIARSFIESYVKNNCYALITSHLSSLKTNWSLPVVCGSMAFDTDHAIPTYHFISGVSGESFAIKTAERIGIKKDILDRAFKYLGPEYKKRFEGLEEIQKSQEKLLNQIQDFKSQKNSYHLKQVELEQEISKLKSEKQSLLDEHQSKLAALEQQFSKELKVKKSFSRLKILEDIQKTAPKLISSVDKDAKRSFVPEDKSKLITPGTLVFIPSLSRDGIVQSPPNSKNEVSVLSQSMRLTLPVEALELKGQKNYKVLKNSLPSKKQKTKSTYTETSSGLITIDIRGNTIQDSIDLVDEKIDLALLDQSTRIKIIHGHGTEKLKKAIRTHLSKNIHIKTWYSGLQTQDSDGTTWAELS